MTRGRGGGGAAAACSTGPTRRAAACRARPRQPEVAGLGRGDRGGAVARRAARRSGSAAARLATQIAAEMRPVDHRLGVVAADARAGSACAATRWRRRRTSPQAYELFLDALRRRRRPHRPGRRASRGARARHRPVRDRDRARRPPRAGGARRAERRSCSPGSCRSRPRRWPSSATPRRRRPPASTACAGRAMASATPTGRWRASRRSSRRCSASRSSEDADAPAHRLRPRRAPRLAARRPARRRPARPAAVRAPPTASSSRWSRWRPDDPRRASRAALSRCTRGFFAELRAAKVPVSLREYLDFLEALDAGLALYDAEAFYYLARASLVKDERHVDRFDRVFAAIFDGLEALTRRGDRRAARPARRLAAQARREAPDARRRRPRSRRSAASRS